MTPGDELFDAVAERLVGSPYAAWRTPDGFVVRRDLAAEDWHVRSRPGSRVAKVVQNHVVLDEETWVLTITDEHVEVTWSDRDGSSVPVFGTALRILQRRGRIAETTVVTTWTDDGPQQHRYDTREVHRHIRAAAEEIGWVEQRGSAERSARAAAVLGFVVGGLTLLGLGLGWAVGAFR
ncbi:hypothetical protein [Cellulomonas triticagri]|uniref:Uncharacterized protein n=1 Tax=Cellulomonas triticagri TaxID=2483352 RepID=A0A3M2JAF9_9CELL|nr:hypothetical protein [Cellulomonas triticagri]RMI09101.1 hypothetical protein EBM89_11760 [Cellulomonas triticagri]